jgi:DnaK suppressor protein
MEVQEGAGGAGLTADQLRLLRGRLEGLRSSLLTRLKYERSVVVEGERRPEALEEAEQTREQDDAVLFSERDRGLLGEIEQALGRLDAGRYGLSELSGRPIGFRRLLAVPWARVAAGEREPDGF